MSADFLQEIYDVRRKHWEEAGKTWEGLCAYHRKFSEEFERKGPDAMLRERLEARRRERESGELAGAVLVSEGDAPEYGGKSGSARDAGAEGE